MAFEGADGALVLDESMQFCVRAGLPGRSRLSQRSAAAPGR